MGVEDFAKGCVQVVVLELWSIKKTLPSGAVDISQPGGSGSIALFEAGCIIGGGEVAAAGAINGVGEVEVGTGAREVEGVEVGRFGAGDVALSSLFFVFVFGISVPSTSAFFLLGLGARSEDGVDFGALRRLPGGEVAAEGEASATYFFGMIKPS